MSTTIWAQNVTVPGTIVSQRVPSLEVTVISDFQGTMMSNVIFLTCASSARAPPVQAPDNTVAAPINRAMVRIGHLGDFNIVFFSVR